MHPLVKILCFLMLLLLISTASSILLFCALVLAIIVIYYLRVDAFPHMVRRMRWLFLSIFIIYAFGTPGELLPQFPVSFAPTFEGINLGWQQIEKLLLALAALALLVTRTSKEHLMLGLYMLLRPLKLAGLNVERFAARLMLTLNYVEELAAEDKSGFSFSKLDEMDDLADTAQQNNVITFHDLEFLLLDKLVMTLLTMVFLLLVYRGFA